MNYNMIAPGYYDSIFRAGHGIQSKWHHQKFEGVRRMLDGIAWSSVLDLGCGPGTFLSTLPSDHDAVGVDIAPGQISYANQHYATNRRRYIVADITRLPFPDNSFDLMTAIDLIEHLDEATNIAFFRELGRCLRPGGHLIINAPNYFITWPVLEWWVSRCQGIDYAAQHISRFRLASLRHFVQTQGWEVTRARNYLLFAPFLAAIRWEWADAFFNLEWRFLRKFGSESCLLLQKCMME